jgi:hypothetical protein
MANPQRLENQGEFAPPTDKLGQLTAQPTSQPLEPMTRLRTS